MQLDLIGNSIGSVIRLDINPRIHSGVYVNSDCNIGTGVTPLEFFSRP